MAPRTSAEAARHVHERRQQAQVPGKSSAVGTPVAGSSVARRRQGRRSISTMLSTVAPTTARAAIRGQRSFWK